MPQYPCLSTQPDTSRGRPVSQDLAGLVDSNKPFRSRKPCYNSLCLPPLPDAFAQLALDESGWPTAAAPPPHGHSAFHWQREHFPVLQHLYI